MLLIKNGKILTMVEEAIENGCILINKGKIIEVDKDIKETNEMKVIDVNGAWVMPGLIDAHCHVGLSLGGVGWEGDDVNERINSVTPYARGIDSVNILDKGFEDAIEGGVTSLMTGPGSANVCGGQSVFMKTKGKSLDDMIVKNPAAMKVAFGENTKNVYSQRTTSPSTRMGTASILRETLFEANKYKVRKDRALKNNENFEIDFKKEPWIDVLDKRIPLKAHAHRADDILTAIRIAKEFDLNMTLDHCTEGHLIAEHVKDSEFDIILGPSLGSVTKPEVQNKTFATAGILNKAGCRVAIMTDHPVVPIQYLALSAGLAAKAGLGIEEGLKAITINPAKICNVDDRVGSLEVGKDADIAIFSGNPMETFTETLYTIIDGNIVYTKDELK
ncbi:amidohydrolase [Romboutsia ilealis]|uniref:Amidohydrolase n=1 Tax=Romboutsia faecis TaxID=2764597 RepID=A0ABR7JPU5_9FIRM|nr:amidohydrolase [Romboutsia faecis]MBC5996875.1 amidohydrolase [Romboutsia faecis]MRN24621.1 amidohydrolase [Romboutsia ilealis]